MAQICGGAKSLLDEKVSNLPLGEPSADKQGTSRMASSGTKYY